jgi:hypothetical protein
MGKRCEYKDKDCLCLREVETWDMVLIQPRKNILLIEALVLELDL